MTACFVKKDADGTVLAFSSSNLGAGFVLADDKDPGVVKYLARTNPDAVTADAVGRERDRRLAAGFSYDFGDARGVHVFATSDEDMKRWSEVALGAQALINLGQPEGAIQIATQTGQASVTATEFQHIMLAAMQFRQPLYQKSFALQAMKPIPADFREDKYW